MDEQTFLALITLAGVIVTAVVTWSIAQRRIAIKHVTAERATWRKQVRKLKLKVHDTILQEDKDGKEKELGRLKSEFTALLNPLDPEDRKILTSITGKGSRHEQEKRATEFDTRISLLLKHDWDRAKLEAGWFLPRWTLEAVRHGVTCTARKGCACKVWYEPRWGDSHSVRSKALVLGIFLIAVLSVSAWSLCH